MDFVEREEDGPLASGFGDGLGDGRWIWIGIVGEWRAGDGNARNGPPVRRAVVGGRVGDALDGRGLRPDMDAGELANAVSSEAETYSSSVPSSVRFDGMREGTAFCDRTEFPSSSSSI